MAGGAFSFSHMKGREQSSRMDMRLRGKLTISLEKEAASMPKALINGTTLHYHVSGKGIPILFVHPPLITSKIFTYQTVQLSASFRTLVYDIRGHGVSDGSETPLSYPLLVEDMKQLLDFLDVKQAFVCGFSTAGQLAIEALLTHPDRFIGGILISGFTHVDDAWNRMRINLTAGMAEWVPGPLRMAIAIGNSDQRQTFKNLYHSSATRHHVDVAQYIRLSLNYRATERLAGVKQPVLMIFGEKDRSFRTYAHEMHRLLPNRSLVFIKDGNHQLPTKQPTKVNRLIHSWISARMNVHPEHEENVYVHLFTDDNQQTVTQQELHQH
jgi:pimeloyl-ACP methyl ester carboxylesterase